MKMKKKRKKELGQEIFGGEKVKIYEPNIEKTKGRRTNNIKRRDKDNR